MLFYSVLQVYIKHPTQFPQMILVMRRFVERSVWRGWDPCVATGKLYWTSFSVAIFASFGKHQQLSWWRLYVLQFTDYRMGCSFAPFLHLLWDVLWFSWLSVVGYLKWCRFMFWFHCMHLLAMWCVCLLLLLIPGAALSILSFSACYPCNCYSLLSLICFLPDMIFYCFLLGLNEKILWKILIICLVPNINPELVGAHLYNILMRLAYYDFY
jgi:hypothetical protein